MVFDAVQGLDIAVLSFFQSIQSPLLTLLFQALSLLGNPVTWIIVVAVLYWDGRERESVLLMSLIVLSGLLTDGLKEVFQRVRPDASKYVVTQEFFRNLIEQSRGYGFSFPSGHATLISSIGGFWFGKVSKYKKIFLVFAVLAVLLARMYLGVHYFVDVVTGLILGLLIAKTAQLGIKKIKTHQVQAESLSYVWALGIVAVSIAVLFWSAVDKLAFGILGFYIGFYLFKRLKLRHDEHKLKQLTGFLGFGLIAVFYWLASAWVILWLFILGLWISLGNPLLHQAADEAVER